MDKETYRQLDRIEGMLIRLNQKLAPPTEEEIKQAEEDK